MSVKEKMTAIADPLRTLVGRTDALTLDEMAEAASLGASNVDNALAAIADKGVSVEDSANSNDLASLIGSIQQGGGTVENTFTVYDNAAGYGVKTFSFEPGMSLRDFVESSYNTDGWYISWMASEIIYVKGMYVLYEAQNTDEIDAPIVAGNVYGLQYYVP